MRILYYFAERDTLMYQWQRFHIFDELSLCGIEIEVFNPLHFSSASESNLQLINKLEKDNFDLFMTPLNEDYLYIDTLKRIQQLSFPTLLICHDNLVVPFYHKNICKYFDLVWLTSQETEKLFNTWGAKTIFLPYAANPTLFTPSYTDESEDINRVCFVGTPYGSRVNMINHLKPNGLFIMTCAGLGRPEHGTSRSNPEASPFTQDINHWKDFYQNRIPEDFKKIPGFSNLHCGYWGINEITCDLYYRGRKKP